MDLAHWFGNDLSVSASGGVLPIDGIVRGQQRVLRRLLTNPGAYIWHTGYGAGLANYIGTPVPAETIKAIVRQQIMLERAVAKTPAPVITVTSSATGAMVVRIVYADADTGVQVTLSFDINQ